MDLRQYIFPIYSGNSIIGQGFIADGFFITAAHLVKDFPSCFIKLNENKIELTKEDPIFFDEYEEDNYHDPQIEDVVIFRFENFNSPLHLSEYIPQKGDILESYCMQEIMDIYSFNPTCEQTIVNAYPLEQEEGNYFYCKCNRLCGYSGSPLLKGNEVVGIMHGSNNKGICVFLKMGAILYHIGDYYYFNIDDSLMDSSDFQPNPTPDYETAFEWYMKAASQKHLEAIYNVARCYERGKGVDEDLEEAIAWYTKSATQGHVESQYTLGKYYLKGGNVSQDYKKAIYWFLLAAEKKHTLSLHELGLCSFKGLGFTRNYGTAIEWFRLAVEAGNVIQDTYYYLGLCYLNNKKNPLSLEVAVKYFQLAGDSNGAFYYLGLCHYNGWGVEKDYYKAFDYYKKAASRFGEFSQKAEYEVAMCYYNGNGVDRDYEEAVRWLNKAYNFNEAFFQLGMCYYKGHGVEKCYNTALRYYKKAAAMGSIKAQPKVAELYNILGAHYKDRRMIENAIEWNLKILEQGDTNSLWSIGHCYETMAYIGYYDKYGEAIKWYKQAWAHNNSSSLMDIMDCYEALFNLGDMEKCEEAIKWFIQVWDQGFIDALEYIGNCYEAMYNLGDKEKINDAIKWYKKAAAFNVYGACKSLCNIYKNGIGVSINKVESEKWAELADKYNPMSMFLKHTKSGNSHPMQE